MDLEDAATDALAKVKALDAELDKAQSAVAEAEQHVKEVGDRLHADWSGLAEEAGPLIEHVHAERGQLGEDGQHAAEALDQLTQRVHAARGEAHQELDNATVQVTTLQQRVVALESDLEHLFEQAEATAGRLEQITAATEGQFDEALEAAHALLQQQMVAHYNSIEHEAEEWAANIGRYVTELWQPLFESMTETWQKSLHAAAAAAIEAGVSAAGANLHDVSAGVLEACRTHHAETFEELATLGQRLETAVHNLEQRVEQGRAAVTHDDAPALEAQQETDAGVEALSEALQKVKELLTGFSFVRM
jgi:tetratricopeptide (TPR) repeat protein